MLVGLRPVSETTARRAITEGVVLKGGRAFVDGAV